MMRVAEEIEECQPRLDPARVNGAHPQLQGSLYHELQIINYMGESLYILDFENKFVEIPMMHYNSLYNHVEITYRQVIGERSYNSYGSEVTKSNHYTMTIRGDLLRKGPIFVEILNAVICTIDYKSDVVHPHSAVYHKLVNHRIYDNLLDNENASHMPILANDPTGEFKFIYTTIHEQVVAIKVMNLVDEPDYVNVHYRTNPLASHVKSRYVTFNTTLEQIIKSPTKTIDLGNGCIVATDPYYLHRAIAERKSQRDLSKYITVEEANKRIDLVKNDMQKHVEDLQRERDILKRQVGVVRSAYDDLQTADLHTQLTHVELTKLDIEKMKLEQQKLELEKKNEALKINHENEMAMEKLRLKKEKYGLIKAGLALIPILIGIGAAIIKFQSVASAPTKEKKT